MSIQLPAQAGARRAGGYEGSTTVFGKAAQPQPGGLGAEGSLGPLVILGLSYTTYAVVLWGALPYMVEARTLGTAFGICTMFQNLGTVIAPPIIGLIQVKTENLKSSEYGYGYVELFFIVISIPVPILKVLPVNLLELINEVKTLAVSLT